MKHLLPLLTLMAGLAASAQPAYLNYQGRLTDSAGQPITGTQTLEFNIYSNAVSGNKVWGPFLCDGGSGPGHTARAFLTADGRFNVILGDLDTNLVSIAQAFTGPTRFVEIKVGTGPAIQPRQQFLSAPYALQAASAQMVNQVSAEHYLNPPGMVVPFAGPASKVPSGWLLCDGTEYRTNQYRALYEAIGKAWGGREDAGGHYFRVPDLRGMFLRGVNGGRGTPYGDPDASGRGPQAPGGNLGDNVGSVQDDTLQNVTGTIGDFNEFAAFHGTPTGPFRKVDNVGGSTGIGAGGADQYDRITMDLSLAARASSETRPNNAYVNYIIKY